MRGSRSHSVMALSEYGYVMTGFRENSRDMGCFNPNLFNEVNGILAITSIHHRCLMKIQER